MRVLITGAGGFVGGHLITHLKTAQPTVVLHGTRLFESEQPHHLLDNSTAIDLKQYSHVKQLLEDFRPEQIYHLAAQAFVPRSFEDPWETLENNILSQLNIIRACLELDLQPRMLIISSAEIYGAIKPEELPLSENTPIRPTNPYSVSKVTQDMLGLQYYLSHNLPIMRARAFNHFGPGQNPNFVAPAFATQIAKIEVGEQESVIYVGNLEAQRDFTDVRDIVRAYELIVNHGLPGQAYNIGSGKTYSVQYLLDTLLTYTDIAIEVRVDESRLRPVDVPVVQADASKLSQHTGWHTTISFEQTLKDVLEDCRQRVRQNQ